MLVVVELPIGDPVWAATAAGRRAVADLVETLTPAQLGTESLCRGWDVHTVAAHLAQAASPSPTRFAWALLRAGGRLHRANDDLARAGGRRPVSEAVALLRERADTRSAPPVTGPRAALTEVLVHGGDIRLPLGVAHDPAPDAVRSALEFVTTGRPFGFVERGRLDGLALRATDLDWASGTGAPVTGRAIDVLMAACGRTAVLPALTGGGVDVLAARLSAPEHGGPAR